MSKKNPQRASVKNTLKRWYRDKTPDFADTLKEAIKRREVRRYFDGKDGVKSPFDEEK